MNSKASPFISAVYFALLTGMYYFNTQYIHIGVDIMYMMLLSCAVTALSVIYYAFNSNRPRADYLIKHAVLLMLPNLTTIIVSLPVWVLELQALSVIRRGLFFQLYGICAVLAMAGVLYVFGKNGFWLNLYAMIAANLITVCSVILENSAAEYLKALKTLVVTFAGTTPEIMLKTEIHELTFAIGLYILYFTVSPERLREKGFSLTAFILAVFCFLSGFKRIGVAALCGALLVNFLMRCMKRRMPKIPFAVSCAAVLCAFGYICAVRLGVFDYLAERFGVDTMGRSELYALIRSHYSMNPSYLGRGAGYISRFFTDNLDTIGVTGLHNDILQVYIDLGFLGFWIWAIAYCPVRAAKIYRWQGSEGAITAMTLFTYVLITGMTDNTIYYTYVTAAVSMIIMSHGFTD